MFESTEFINCDLTQEHIHKPPFDFSFFSKKSSHHTSNQDSSAFFLTDRFGIFAVADGAGGHPDGDACSSHAIKTLTSCLKDIKNPSLDLIRIAIINAFQKTNDYVLNSIRGSASTLSVCLVDYEKNLLHTFHAGDSYIFVIGGLGKEKFKTPGHSVLDMGLESGLITKLTPDNEHLRHELINVIGLPSLKIEISQPVELNEQDSIFVCSDGLSDNLSMHQISENSKVRDVAKITEQLCKQVDEIKKSESPYAKEDDMSFFVIKKTSC